MTRGRSTSGAAEPGAGPGPDRAVHVLNGPNLDLLGTREPEHYGTATLADIEAMCRAEAARLGLTVDFRQTSSEGLLVDWVHEVGREVVAGRSIGAVLNAGAYTHTSIALHDAIVGAAVPVVELHVSNVHARETFRHHSYLSPAVRGIVVGFGPVGYPLAVRGLHDLATTPGAG